MDVILLQKVANLGNIGDRVKVRSGYGRNFLLPGGKATLATPDNVKRFEARREELEKLAREHLSSAEERAAAMKDFKLGDVRGRGQGGLALGQQEVAAVAGLDLYPVADGAEVGNLLKKNDIHGGSQC